MLHQIQLVSFRLSYINEHMFTHRRSDRYTPHSPAGEISMNESILFKESHSVGYLHGVLEQSSHRHFADHRHAVRKVRRRLRLHRYPVLLQVVTQGTERGQFSDHHQRRRKHNSVQFNQVWMVKRMHRTDLRKH